MKIGNEGTEAGFVDTAEGRRLQIVQGSQKVLLPMAESRMVAALIHSEIKKTR